MPTNLYRRNLPYSAPYPTVLASDYGMRSPRMITLDMTTILANGDGAFLILPGSVIIRQANGLGRVLQATRTALAALSGATTITVRNASLFTPGQVLAGIGTIAAAGVNLLTNVLTLTVALAANLAANSLVFVTAGNPTTLYVTSTNTEGVWGIVLSLVDVGAFPNDLALYSSCSVYAARLPYWDSNLITAFPGITLV